MSISIHSPRMGRDVRYTLPASVALSFQSTLPAWGETDRRNQDASTRTISIHSPRMGRDNPRNNREVRRSSNFNPLSPHGERLTSGTLTFTKLGFQSTLPAWGETRESRRRHARWRISIHSPRMGRDHRRSGRPANGDDFNPLSPHGERQQTHTTFRREKLAHLHNIVSFRQQRGSSC